MAPISLYSSIFPLLFFLIIYIPLMFWRDLWTLNSKSKIHPRVLLTNSKLSWIPQCASYSLSSFGLYKILSLALKACSMDFSGLLIFSTNYFIQTSLSQGSRKISATNNVDSLKPVHRNFGDRGNFASVVDKIIRSFCCVFAWKTFQA